MRLLSASAIEQARTLQSEGTDATIGVENRYALGFQLPSPALGDPRPETASGTQVSGARRPSRTRARGSASPT